MTAVLSPQDWQQLSEYLDNQLQASDRSEVEKLLSTSTEWQIALQSLSNTRTALRSAPKRRAPRNFTLTVTQASQIRKPKKQVLIFRFSSAISTSLAILFLVLGITFQNQPISLTMAAAAEMNQKADTAVEATAIPIIIWGAPEMNPYFYGSSDSFYGGRGGVGSGGGGEFDSAEIAPSLEKSGPLTEVPQPSAAGQATVQAVIPEQPQDVPSIVALSEPNYPVIGTGPILGIQSTAPAAIEPQEQRAPMPASVPQTDQNQNKQTLYWACAMGMFVLAIISTYFGWKPSRKKHS